MVSRSCSDLSKSSRLPVAVDIGRLWPHGELLWSRFPIEESGSTLGASDGHMGVDELVAEDLKTSTFLQSAILKYNNEVSTIDAHV